ncbi:hypothetical protein [Thalassospira lucentensis]|uniref:hypothetical protein n=1 Tax=Thalassospira lucentensis TaxID=168935 RepID=UPI0003B49771|nr:hypothetical protein [Thalassospira lucentensis]RCK26894.1 hypothetical protein TH1_11520 [Thalassospira lucentensis MCCC 1A00383 = DSM 14000]
MSDIGRAFCTGDAIACPADLIGDCAPIWQEKSVDRAAIGHLWEGVTTIFDTFVWLIVMVKVFS